MKNEAVTKNKNRGFTIVELLTVMAVILILMSLLVPALNQLRIHAYYVKQKNQFKGIDIGIEFYNTDREGYPDSGEFDRGVPLLNIPPAPYCGALKLAEAMVGQDLLGFNPQSKFYQVGTIDGAPLSMPPGIPSGVLGSTIPPGNDLYPARRDMPNPVLVNASIKERKELYLKLEGANAYRLGDLYNVSTPEFQNIFPTGPSGIPPASLPVLCDVYTTAFNNRTGQNVGMPILYYKANTNKTSHDYSPAAMQLMMQPPLPNGQHQNPYNIYNFWDNDRIVSLGQPTKSVADAGPIFQQQPMSSGNFNPADPTVGPQLFYRETMNINASNVAAGLNRPFKADTYILMSAGFDGLYGTKDDVFNF